MDELADRIVQFLSTLPVRGATGRCPRPARRSAFLSTLPVRGATPQVQHGIADGNISIHAPREGSDLCVALAVDFFVKFLSTLPVRGATHAHRHGMYEDEISIHAPREGSDLAELQKIKQLLISIHAPREGSDRKSWRRSRSRPGFLSTLPVRGATSSSVAASMPTPFLSTLPVRGATGAMRTTPITSPYFYPRSP